MRLKRKVAIVTGSSKGLGRVIALTMAEEGAEVVINDVDEESLWGTLREMKDLGRTAIAVRADVSNAQQVKKMVQESVEAFGRVDILVNNAGGALGAPHKIEETR